MDVGFKKIIICMIEITLAELNISTNTTFFDTRRANLDVLAFLNVSISYHCKHDPLEYGRCDGFLKPMRQIVGSISRLLDNSD